MRYMIQVFAILFLSLTVLYASADDFRKIHEEANRAFSQALSTQIRSSVGSASGAVQQVYAAIGYKPVWVDKEYLSSFSVMFLGELKDDLDHGALLSLKQPYEAVIKMSKDLSESSSMEKKLQVERAMMQLYVDYIDAILKGTDSRLTPAVLLKASLKRDSLVHSFNLLANARIEKRTPVIRKNERILGSKIRIDGNLTKKLTRGSDKERLKEMYKCLDFHPVWVSEKGLSSYTEELFHTIETDRIFDHSGPTYRTFEKLKSLPVPKTKEEIVAREFAIAKLYQDYMGYLLYGAIDWKKFKQKLRKTHKHGAWDVHDVLLSPELLLIESVQKKTLKHAFEKVKPAYPGYDAMVKALRTYRKIAQAGGWPELPDFKDLKPGMHSSVVPLLRERLKIEGDYVPCAGIAANSTHYDSCLLEAVKRFQSRHGLEAEGYIGKMTRKALAETAAHKYVRLRLNLARLKWLKRDNSRYHIVVNIPDFMITVYDEWKPMEKMRVVTGRKGHETPIFYNRVKRIVLNPYWRIPPSIIRHETLPKLKKDSGYTNKKHIEIHTGYSEHSPRVNPYKVNWHKYGRKLPPYKFMQSPGNFNALGKVKFLFPNSYSVYMHDTPEKALFKRDIRAYSHGCVRLARPIDMLAAFAEMDKKVDFEKAEKILEKNKKTPIRLSRSIPIDMIYITAWVDKTGKVQFRDDIYGYDALQMETAKWLPSPKVKVSSSQEKNTKAS
ncbi:L,D-transpeptidase family protein [Sulfurovum sp.]|uniref:L,D-transpeptidase family protein n=1 Tax=Sulfurovum sp. TaxID=1969726 RepID=UPI0025D1771D|nr:L,D-transpeptidase family protein [Sulfurovum sp.]